MVMVLGHYSSNVSQGSVLIYLQLVAYINDIDAKLKNVTVLEYEGDIKMCLAIKRTHPMRYRSFLQSDVETT